MSTLACPQCSLPATVLDRFTLGTSSGERIEHVRISCPAAHHFLAALDRIAEITPFDYVAPPAPVTANAT